MKYGERTYDKLVSPEGKEAFHEITVVFDETGEKVTGIIYGVDESIGKVIKVQGKDLMNYTGQRIVSHDWNGALVSTRANIERILSELGIKKSKAA